MAGKEMMKQEEKHTLTREDTRSAGRVFVPAVDIFESDEELTLVADMPGVAKDGLDINLEKGVLTINGEVSLESRGKSLLRELPAANYYRQFKLSEHIDAERTSAELSNGVLTLTIPKAESARPQRIEIRH